MKQVPEMPVNGQFVAIWEFRGQIWSDTFKYIDGNLYCYVDNNFGEHLEYVWVIYDDLEVIKDARFYIYTKPGTGINNYDRE